MNILKKLQNTKKILKLLRAGDDLIKETINDNHYKVYILKMNPSRFKRKIKNKKFVYQLVSKIIFKELTKKN